MKRSAGILCPIFSLPSNYGIGTLGQSAYDFIDFLSDSNQTYWQILPIGGTGYHRINHFPSMREIHILLI